MRLSQTVQPGISGRGKQPGQWVPRGSVVFPGGKGLETGLCKGVLRRVDIAKQTRQGGNGPRALLIERGLQPVGHATILTSARRRPMQQV